MKSDQIDKLAEALSKAQGMMDIAVKDSSNPCFKYSYADLKSSWKACRNALSKNGLAIAQIIEIREQGLILNTTLMHSSGQWISSFCPIKPVKPDPQAMGSAITYAKRYSLNAIVGITSDNEDDDGNAASERPEMKKLVEDDGNAASGRLEMKKLVEVKAQNIPSPVKKTIPSLTEHAKVDEPPPWVR